MSNNETQSSAELFDIEAEREDAAQRNRSICNAFVRKAMKAFMVENPHIDAGALATACNEASNVLWSIHRAKSMARMEPVPVPATANMAARSR